MDSTENIEFSAKEIEAQIQQTKASLNEKIESLKTEVQSSAQEASNSMQETVDTIKNTFSVNHQIEKRPWLAFGAAVAVGVGLSVIFLNKQNAAKIARSPLKSDVGNEPTLFNRWEPEILSAKNIALGAIIGLIGSLIQDALPNSIQPEVSRVIGDIRRKITSL